MLQKKLGFQETKVKALTGDIEKMRKNKTDLEVRIREETDRFTKYKNSVSQDLRDAERSKEESKHQMEKMKLDLRKADEYASQKASELREIQIKIRNERLKMQIEENQEENRIGINVEVIKDWIKDNTSKMLENRRVREDLEKQIIERDRIEDEMLECGEALTEITLEKERKR